MPKQERYPGIIAMSDGRKRIRLRAVDPRTGRMKEVDRVVTVPMGEAIVLQQIIVSGITVGAIYALIAIGFTIVFSTVRIVNFAHGEFVMAGGMIYAWLAVVHQVPVFAAVGLSIVVCMVLAWLVYELGLAGMDKDNHIATVNNLLVANANMDQKTAYDIIKAVFDHKDDLVRTHKEAENIKLENQKKDASPVPWHPGAVKYFAEKGIKLP